MTTTQAPLSALDRCDACSAQAKVRARKQKLPATLEELTFGVPQFSELLFCDHHHRAHFDALVDEGWSFT